MRADEWSLFRTSQSRGSNKTDGVGRVGHRYGPRHAFAAGLIAFGVAASVGASAQDITDLQTPKSPLILKAQGSFIVGGEKVERTAKELGVEFFGWKRPGHTTINQMYVQYMIPEAERSKVPVVMVHGGTMTGKSWETTPDGRMGWDEYFVRKGHAVYKVDQVSRARSGFDAGPFNDVRGGIKPPDSQQNLLVFVDELLWTLFRLGPSPGVPFPDTQFPVEAFDKFSKSAVPDINFTVPQISDRTISSLSVLANQLNGAVLMGHSRSSEFPTRAALKPGSSGIAGIIQLEAGCVADLKPADIDILKNIPILIMVGDRFPQPPACATMMQQINSAGGDMTYIALPDVGLRGNSHMFMLDKNNLQVADVIMDWIDKHVGQKKGQK